MGETPNHLYAVATDGTTTDTTPPTGAARAPKKARPDKVVPTDRMKFDTQVQALAAVVVASKNGAQAVDAEDMAGLMGVKAMTAILNNAFFVDVGLIEKVGKGEYKPKDIAIGWQRQHSFGSNEAPKQLAPAFAKTWFFEAVQQRLQMGTPTVPQMVETLAAVAGTDASYTTQLGFLLDWLEYVGLITTASGTVRVAAAEIVNLTDPEPNVTENNTPVTPPKPESTRATAPQVERGNAVVSLSFDMYVTADDLAKLTADQIAALFDGIGKIAAVKVALDKV